MNEEFAPEVFPIPDNIPPEESLDTRLTPVPPEPSAAEESVTSADRESPSFETPDSEGLSDNMLSVEDAATLSDSAYGFTDTPDLAELPELSDDIPVLPVYTDTLDLSGDSQIYTPEYGSMSETPEEAPGDSLADEAVTDIILDTLAQQDLEGAQGPVLSPEETNQVLDDLISAMGSSPADAAPEEYSAATEEIIYETTESEPVPKKERPVRKGRPKRKSGDGLLSIPHLLSAAIWLVIIVAIGVTLGRGIWVCAADVLAFGRESKEVTISITADDTMESIAEKLHDAGLINIPDLFLLYANLTGVEEEHKITTGTFTLNTVYDYMALVSHMGPRATNRVVVEDVLIPEGFNCRQIFALLEEKGICKAADLEAYAASGELKEYWFLEDVPRGDKYCLEGFLFPDTYDFYENSTPKMALEKMLDGFRYRFSEELKAQIPVLNERLTEMMRKNGESEEFIAANQLTLRDVLTVASLIEEETANTDESYRIASVIYNRLFSWGNTPRYLNIDATVIYALGGKTDLNHEDMAVDNPYNTYTNTGLTPGPISNPGLASIQAALNFEDTSYYYYTLNYSTGEHQFSKTYEEHVKWVEKFNKEKNNG